MRLPPVAWMRSEARTNAVPSQMVRGVHLVVTTSNLLSEVLNVRPGDVAEHLVPPGVAENSERIERDNPRLKDARQLLQDRAVAPSANGWSITSGNHRHWVKSDPYTCTCLWWAKYHGQRGPCKHVLAVTLYVQAQH